MKKPVVVFVFSKNRGATSARFGGFAKKLQRHGHLVDCELQTVALEDLVITVNHAQKASIVNHDGKPVFDNASLVYFKSWESMPEVAAAVEVFLHSRGIPMLDALVHGQGFSKLSQLMRIWEEGARVTPFVYSYRLPSPDLVAKLLGTGPYIVKDIFGEKGRDNFFVKQPSDLGTHWSDNGSMCIQPFIENDGDYRVFVYGEKVRGAIYRTRNSSSHLNNTSAGASSEYVPKSRLSPKLVSAAITAARACRLSIAGVDVMQRTSSDEWYVLEANQGSQIVTGHFTDKKMAAFAAFFEEALSRRYTIKRPKKLALIGRHVRVDFPDHALNGIMAKVDTGAYRSALHASHIHENNGVLEFTVEYDDADKKRIKKSISTTAYARAYVRNSSGKSEERFRVDMNALIGGRLYPMHVTLTNRGGMKFPLLIGRRVLRGNFIVNPELSRKAYEEKL